MCDNLITQTIYRVIFCVISAFAVVLSLGFFSVGGADHFTISHDFWQYYTNLSNYYCFGIGVAVCASTVDKVRRGERRGYNTCAPTLKFCGVVMILVTFLVYISLLGKVWQPNFWNNIGNLCYHVIAPLLFIFDFLLFDKHKSIKILDPLKATIMPLLYVAYILIYGAVCRAVGARFEYPYFFLNVDGITYSGEKIADDAIGYGGVAVWVVILFFVFAALGYLLFVYDKLVKSYGRWKLDFKDVKLR